MNLDVFKGVSIGVVLGFLFGGIYVGLISRDNLRDFKREAIKNSFAEYNSINGEWQWKTNQNYAQ